MYEEHIRAAARSMAENMQRSPVPMYGKGLRLPDKGAVIGLLKEIRRLVFPAYYGDPELMTLQAVRLIRQCPVLAAPQTASGQMLALDIARSALGEALDGKTIVPLHFAMSRDPAVLAASHKEAVQAVRPYLDAGQDTAMLNLGDVSIYATFGYLQCLLEAEGYPTAMAAGVPSFCAAAARLNVPLTGGMDTPLTIAPLSLIHI